MLCASEVYIKQLSHSIIFFIEDDIRSKAVRGDYTPVVIGTDCKSKYYVAKDGFYMNSKRVLRFNPTVRDEGRVLNMIYNSLKKGNHYLLFLKRSVSSDSTLKICYLKQ